MKKQDLINIIFTFFVGFFSGAYLYVAVFAPTVQQAETVIEEIGEAFVVTGEAYGGCDRVGSCPSFQIADGGEYRYIYLPRDANSQALREGTLPLDIQQKLRRYATAGVLTEQSVRIDPAMCESYVDGIDVRYKIEIGESSFVLDSCGTDVDAESRAWIELSGLWDYFQQSR